MQIQAEEQQQLLAHRRAITEELPEEINPIAVGQSGQWQGNAPQTALPANVVSLPNRETIAQTTASASWDARD